MSTWHTPAPPAQPTNPEPLQEQPDPEKHSVPKPPDDGHEHPKQ